MHEQLKMSLSIVSHGHREHVGRLFEDLRRIGRSDLEVILTLNLPEPLPDGADALPFELKVLRNAAPLGFGANHNQAYAASRGRVFAILNPDIRLVDDPFGPLLELLERKPDAVCAPVILNEAQVPEDSARSFPTPVFLLRKLAGKLFGRPPRDKAIPATDELLMPDWVAGMFIVVPRAVYDRLRGFDERYFLYYEDVDFCARARLAGCEILVCRRARAVHHAQRDSHRRLRYLMWHVRSALRFFTSGAYLKLHLRRMLKA